VEILLRPARKKKNTLCAILECSAGGRAKRGVYPSFSTTNFELRGDAVDQLHGDHRFAHNLDGLIERDAALIDLEALRGERRGEIRGSDRSKQLVRFRPAFRANLTVTLLSRAACCSAAPFSVAVRLESVMRIFFPGV